MSSVFGAITEEFERELNVVRTILSQQSRRNQRNARVRIAVSNSLVLLLAATFEEYIREMARTFARRRVESAKNWQQLPKKLVATAWRRTAEELSKQKIDAGVSAKQAMEFAASVQRRFDAVHGFLLGDLTRDIYDDLIHNDRNMGSRQVNELFAICDYSNVCKDVSQSGEVSMALYEPDLDRTPGLLTARLDNFVRRRNEIAHSLGKTVSPSPELLENDIVLFWAFGRALARILEAKCPALVPAT